MDSDFAFVASVSCSIVSSMGIAGGGVELLYESPLIRSLISEVPVVSRWYVPFKIASLCKYGDKGCLIV